VIGGEGGVQAEGCAEELRGVLHVRGLGQGRVAAPPRPPPPPPDGPPCCACCAALLQGDILEDIDLIENLEETKRTATDIEEKVKLAKSTELSIRWAGGAGSPTPRGRGGGRGPAGALLPADDNPGQAWAQACMPGSA
jgi:hypothetical protein